MPANKTNLVLRNDTILGVCEAIGQDFGFHPNWLRLAFASLFYWFPLGLVGTYLGLGLIVAATRWFSPDTSEAAPAQLNVLPVITETSETEDTVALAA